MTLTAFRSALNQLYFRFTLVREATRQHERFGDYRSSPRSRRRRIPASIAFQDYNGACCFRLCVSKCS
jgi:hypothetical protein